MTIAAWTPAASALSAAPGASALSTFAEFMVDANGLFHQFAHVDGTTPGIWHATSADGEAWTWDARVLAPGSETWENLTVGVPTVWVEADTWHMLYRGTGNGAFVIGIGHATASAPGGPWTRTQSNPSYVIGGAGNTGEAGPGRLIKVGSTYYLHASSLSATRSVFVYSSTDLVTWTNDPAGNIWTGGRFCNCIWVENGVYYSLVPAYRNGTSAPADIELWRSTTPQFYAATREFLGVILPAGGAGNWSEGCLDTPTVVTTDITKSAYATGGKPWVYYAGMTAGGSWRSGLIKDVDIHGDSASWAVGDYPAGWFTANNRPAYVSGALLTLTGATYAAGRVAWAANPPSTGLRSGW
jgi:hypothetical protein